MKSLFIIFACLLTSFTSAWAHPVAQGSLQIILVEDSIKLVMRASYEQVFLEQSFSPGENKTETPWDAHAKYILSKLELIRNSGEIVQGRVESALAHDSRNTPGMGEFVFVYNGTVGPNDKYILRQNLLREFEFAPGNPWEATFVTEVLLLSGKKTGPFLFTHAKPVEISIQQMTAVTDSRLTLATEYLRHGVHHILSGYDHLLFVGALVLAVVSLWDLVKVITVFTIAHTITLTLAVLGYARLPSSIVEPMIAASIVFVALQNVFWPEKTRGVLRLLVAFFFGLFHGLGFAGGLSDVMSEFPETSLAVAIVAFSIGVELGHQVVAIPIFLLVNGAERVRMKLQKETAVRPIALRLGSVMICIAGCYYFVSAVWH